MPRVTKAQKIAEYDRRQTDEYRAHQHTAANALRTLMKGLDDEQTKTLAFYLKTAEAEYQLVRNARFGGFCVEHKDTPWSCSVASDAYWQN